MSSEIDPAKFKPSIPRIGYWCEEFATLSEIAFTGTVNAFYKDIFLGDIGPRKVYDAIGSGPFHGDGLYYLIQRMGLFLHENPEGEKWDDDEVPEPEPPYIFVIGREEFRPEYLRKHLLNRFEAGNVAYIFLSQEDFLNHWLFGEGTDYAPGDPRIDEHPGLAFLAANDEHPWPWPSTEVQSGVGLTDTGEFSVESELKRRFGYSVSKQKGLTDSQRQRILDRAVPALSLYEIANHLAFLVRFNKARRNPEPFAQALAKWERDLDYLKRTYYHKQFSWPSTDPD